MGLELKNERNLQDGFQTLIKRQIPSLMKLGNRYGARLKYPATIIMNCWWNWNRPIHNVS